MEDFNLDVKKNVLKDEPEEKEKKTEKDKKKTLVPIGAKILWLLNKKEYTKENDEKPFSKWTSLTGGTLLIDDERVLRKDVFTLLSK